MVAAPRGPHVEQYVPDVVIGQVDDRPKDQTALYVVVAIEPAFAFVRRVRSIRCARAIDSALRTPSNRITSPLAAAFSRMNRVVGRIFIRSVHHRKLRLGAGYPRPSRVDPKCRILLRMGQTTSTGKPRATMPSSMKLSDFSTRDW